MLRYFSQNYYPSHQLMESGAGAPRFCGSESMGGSEGGSFLALSFTPLWILIRTQVSQWLAAVI